MVMFIYYKAHFQTGMKDVINFDIKKTLMNEKVILQRCR